MLFACEEQTKVHEFRIIHYSKNELSCVVEIGLSMDHWATKRLTEHADTRKFNLRIRYCHAVMRKSNLEPEESNSR